MANQKFLRHAFYVLLAFLLLGIFLILDRAYATDQIIRPYRGIRAMGMGGVLYTTGLYEENFYGNPARVTANPAWRLQLLDPLIEISSNTLSQIGEILGSSDVVQEIADTAGENNHFRVQFSFPGLYLPNFLGSRWSAAFAILTSIQGDAILRNNFDIQPSLITDIGPAFTLGRKFLKNDALSIGITTHLAYRLASPSNLGFQSIIQGQSLAPNDLGQEGAHLDFSTGATYRLPLRLLKWDLTVGFAINHLLGGKYSQLGAKLINTTDLTPPRPSHRTYNFGIAAHRDRLWKFRDALLALEITDIGNNANGSWFRLLHIGGEIQWKLLAIRAGINQGYWALGLGLDLALLEIGLACYGEELGLNVGDQEDRRLALRLSLKI